MVDLRCDATGELGPADLRALRGLLNAAYGGRFDEHDWRHALGGYHVRGFAEDQLVAHASVVPRRLWCGDTEVHAGYVEAVAVHPDAQRNGYGAAVTLAAVDVIRDHYELGALCAGEDAARLYERLGWQVWQGPSFVATPDGPRATPEEDGAILVLPLRDIDITQPITCEWRSGDVW